ncbi:MAG: HAMP domain-containing histidine kinase [Actinomycetota bacterium]|nr:HAMP domain-containing histidine kinase [Actinomycetota bacterium]
MIRYPLALVVVAVILLAGSLGIIVELPMTDIMVLAGIAMTAAVVSGAFGVALLHALRNASASLQATVAVGTGTAAVAVGAGIAAKAMFISAHDLDALLIVLAAASAIGMAIAVWFGHKVALSTGSLVDAARRIARGEVVRHIDPLNTRELDELAQELERTSVNLDAARSREAAMEASRRELVAWVSHDLRTPLAGIRAMSEALEDGVVSDRQTVGRYHKALRVEADRLAGLVDDLFELSRIQAGALRLEMQCVPLHDLVSDALAGVAGVARAKNVKLEGRMAGEGAELDVALPEMARVVRNLLENAIHHTPSDGTVYIEATAARDQAFLSVIDSCGGIPESDIERVFEVAFRGEASRSSEDKRGGLGLAISKGIVEAHHGDIAVHNEEVGCRFTVKLPLEQPQATE